MAKKIVKMPYNGIPFVSNLFRKRIENSEKFADIKDDSIILDVGCNDGYLLKFIRSKNKFCKCYGVDNTEGLEIIDTCDVRVADVTNLPFENNFFDTVFVLDILEHVKDLDKTLDEIKRVLKANGSIILSGPTETWFYKLCRLFYRQMIGHEEHVRTIYDIEEKIQSKKFQLINKKTLPGFPIPELFRISKFMNIKN